MRKYHSHGYAQKSHLLTKKHTDKRAKKAHDKEVKLYEKVNKKKQKVAKKGQAKSAKCAKRITKKKTISLPIDKDGYIFVDLTKVKHGLRVKSIETGYRNKKTIGVQFEKN